MLFSRYIFRPLLHEANVVGLNTDGLRACVSFAGRLLFRTKMRIGALPENRDFHLKVLEDTFVMLLRMSDERHEGHHRDGHTESDDGSELPRPVRTTMRLAARVMTTSSYWV